MAENWRPDSVGAAFESGSGIGTRHSGLSDPDPEVRCAAAEALKWSIGTERLFSRRFDQVRHT
jgi:hypothetical protein